MGWFGLLRLDSLGLLMYSLLGACHYSYPVVTLIIHRFNSSCHLKLGFIFTQHTRFQLNAASHHTFSTTTQVGLNWVERSLHGFSHPVGHSTGTKHSLYTDRHTRGSPCGRRLTDLSHSGQKRGEERQWLCAFFPLRVKGCQVSGCMRLVFLNCRLTWIETSGDLM